MADKIILDTGKVHASVYRENEEIQLSLRYSGDVAKEVCDVLSGVVSKSKVEDYLDQKSKSCFQRNFTKFQKQVISDSGGRVKVLHFTINVPVAPPRRALCISVTSFNGDRAPDPILFYFDLEVTENQFEQLYDNLATNFENLVRHTNEFKK